MAKYFKNVTSFDDLKAQFRALAKENHPDAGGSVEIMTAINAEYDILFPIWKERGNISTNETAESTRREFYTANGWAGSNYMADRPLKEIAAIVRKYAKERYPDFKFSVRMRDYRVLDVNLTEGKREVFAGPAQNYYRHRLGDRNYLTREAARMLDDVCRFVQSYNREDCDAMIDYFDVAFWFHGVGVYSYKVNPSCGNGRKPHKGTGMEVA